MLKFDLNFKHNFDFDFVALTLTAFVVKNNTF